MSALWIYSFPAFPTINYIVAMDRHHRSDEIPMGHKAEEEEEKSLAGLASLVGADGRSGPIDNTGLASDGRAVALTRWGFKHTHKPGLPETRCRWWAFFLRQDRAPFPGFQ